MGNNEVGPGARITQLDPADAAAQAGLKMDDVILAVCGTPVEDHAHTITLFEKNAKSLLDILIVPAAEEELSRPTLTPPPLPAQSLMPHT